MLRSDFGFRTSNHGTPIRVVGRLLLFVLVSGALIQAQSAPGSQNQGCEPGTTCPTPQEPARATNPNIIIGNQPRSEAERPKERAQPEKAPSRGQPPVVAPEVAPQAEAAPPPPPVYTEFQQFVFSSIGRMLPMYGYNLFDKVPSTFAPVDQIPVPADYVIGPGDEILLRGWGQIDLDVRIAVDRNGSIFIPKVGNLQVAGLRYHQLHDYLQAAIGRVFRNFELSVTLGELRSIQVFVVGQARRPGSYTVSSLSTLVNTLFASGGPGPAGSMRRIQLKRNNQVVTEFDFYDLLLNGDKSKDAILLPGDVIYVPPIGPLVALAGSVNVPAIYELKGKTSLAEAMQLAGLLSTTAAGQKATVERIENRAVRKVEEFPLDESGLARPLQDGDLVNIISLSPRFENAVTLRGNVAQPGRYPWHLGMRVSDLIPNREMLITREYWLKQNLAPEGAAARLSREAIVNSPDGTIPPEPFRSDWIKQEIPVQPGGEALIRTSVKRNAPEVNWDYAVIQRLDAENLSTRLLPFNLGKAILGHEEASNLALQPGDIVTIFSHADLQVPIARQSKFVRLEGEFQAAGVYQVGEGDTLRDLVARAGGLTENAYLFGSEFTRDSTRITQQKRLDTYLDQLEQEIERFASSATRNVLTAEEATALQARVEGQRRLVQKLRQVKTTGRVVLDMKGKDASLADLPGLSLEDGDRFLVPVRPATVNVLGAVYNEAPHLYRSGRSVSDYVRAAGGATRDADGRHTFVIRADGSVVGRGSNSRLWGENFNSLRLMPGDTIVVPEQLGKVGFLRGLRDWAQVISQFALGAAAVRVLNRP